MDNVVTVVIPTFGRRELTDRAVESVKTSYPQLVEVVVVDDCGHEAYGFRSKNTSNVPVRVVRTERNVGPGMARAVGVRKARGKYIAFLDSDDAYAPEWIDWVIGELQSRFIPRGLLIAGISIGERKTGLVVKQLCRHVPSHLKLILLRVISVFFNPFSTPSVVVERSLCRFRPGLRYCEDYYTSISALFDCKEVLLPAVVSCDLGRAPNTPGGESGMRAKMFSGEMEVRKAMWEECFVTGPYRILIPFGVVYQYVRSWSKGLFSRLGP